MTSRHLVLPLLAIAVAVGGSLAVTGCAPVIIAGAVAGTAMVASDRRSAGAQLDDQTIELRSSTAIGTQYAERVHANVTSFNGTALVTGEVPDSTVMNGVIDIVRKQERVRSVQSELVVAPPSSLGDRSNDTLITSKVKARFVEANEFGATYVKVVTERGVVYLMGLVTRAEADAAARLASQTSGVVRVVRVFEYMG